MTIKAWITYERIDPDDNFDGEPSERGYFDPDGNWHFSFPEELPTGELAVTYRNQNELRLKQAIAWAQNRFWEPSTSPSRYAGPGDWWTTIDSDTDYRTGEQTTYSLHLPDTITRASWQRVHRLICGK